MPGTTTLPVTPRKAGEASSLARVRYVPREIDLFMYCAATWNTHRIHYDREYARAEGYRDLVVPGPLQSARLAQLLADVAVAHGGRLQSMSIRHHAPLFCNEALELRADLVSMTSADGVSLLDVAVAVESDSGVTGSNGSATLTFDVAVADAAWLAVVAGSLP